jgi:hypothetical protein
MVSQYLLAFLSGVLSSCEVTSQSLCTYVDDVGTTNCFHLLHIMQTSSSSDPGASIKISTA